MRTRPLTGALCLAVLALAAPAARAATARETVDETFAFEAGALLTLDNVNGSVRLETWDREEIRVVAEKKTRAASSGRAEDLLDALEVRMEPTGRGLTIETRHPRPSDGVFSWMFGGGGDGQVEYRITLPRRADLDVTTVNGGVEIVGVSGRLRLRSTNGRIDVEDGGGSVDAATTNGGIVAELWELSGVDDLSLRTTNGGIRLSLPADAGAELSAHTTNGSIETDLPLRIHGRLHRTRIEGTLNSGGPQLDLSTTNGSIRIASLSPS
jgi:hypothetical protein